MGKSLYYNAVKIINNKYPFNFLIGNRTAGKSFAFKRFCVQDYIKNGHQFIYLRRNTTDLTALITKWWEDISPKFPNHSVELSIKDNVGTFKLLTYEDGEIINSEEIGFAMAMSTLHKKKSIVFDRVETIFFDEFLPENLQYINPSDPLYEPNQLVGLYITVARGYKEFVRESVKIICVANNVSIYNPYFSAFEIDLTNQETVVVDGVYAERFINEAAAKALDESVIGPVLRKTTYGQYATGNISMNDSLTHIAKHPRYATPMFMVYLHKWYMAWLDHTSGNVYFSQTNDTTFKQRYKLMELPVEDGEVAWFTGDILKLMRNLMIDDKVYYESGKIKAVLHAMFIPKLRI